MKERWMEKTKGKKKDGKNTALNDNFITVQRLSAEVSGKAQKYSRIGARVFVPFEFGELTIDNIKIACLSHFAVDPSMTCNIVAGEQGPSCRSLRQVRDSKVIHVRFIPEPNNELEAIDDQSASCTIQSPLQQKRSVLPFKVQPSWNRNRCQQRRHVVQVSLSQEAFCL